jgi:hypothetical protein
MPMDNVVIDTGCSYTCYRGIDAEFIRRCNRHDLRWYFYIMIGVGSVPKLVLVIGSVDPAANSFTHRYKVGFAALEHVSNVVRLTLEDDHRDVILQALQDLHAVVGVGSSSMLPADVSELNPAG